ncbi:GNAT family N-acetyltransferase [Massilia antarctica]|uniref:GNAT family N-acetyltransferase n=1 Tax=Massilia antarctica TaxID=2765360 RepID=A0AA48WEE2_9BURK|nr:GNAT family protein [Massilia antarctica]QPI50069.1 GNAT family N-acetyltransferase [Massilia antarctica]QPI50099.1 GNAT family N-acetyltransferase [Massilia antarctica]
MQALPAPGIRTLAHGDAGALLAFELANRAWFERHVEARDPAFYSPDGVARHIAHYLDGHAAGTWHPCVLLDGEGRIVGRANLKDIDRIKGSAEVGYRIAHDQTGKGLATFALQHLIGLARSSWQLNELRAKVTLANQGSAAVLHKCGFVHAGDLTRLATVDKARVDGAVYLLDLTPA